MSDCILKATSPSFQRGWAVEAAEGQLIWVEGSADEEAEQQ